ELFFEDRGVNEPSETLLLHPRGGYQEDFPFPDVDSTGDFSGSFGEEADVATVEKQLHTVTDQLRVPQHIDLVGVHLDVVELVENFFRVKLARRPGSSRPQDDCEEKPTPHPQRGPVAATKTRFSVSSLPHPFSSSLLL